MSAKQFKSMRRSVRAVGFHPREVKLLATQKANGPRIIDKNCGRGLYKKLKKAERSGDLAKTLAANAA